MLYTASAFISFYSKLEDKTSNMYESLMNDKRCIEVKDTFNTFVKENRRYKERILRSYQEVITDALEAAFPQENLDENDYEIKINITDELSFQDIIKKAIETEENCYRFCRDAGESLKSLLADVPDAFSWVSKRKYRRIEHLKSFLNL